MRRLISSILLAGFAAAAAGCEASDPAPAPEIAPEETRSIGSVDRRLAAMDSVVAPGAEIEILAEGFTWPEGPAWVEAEQALYFNDVPENKMHRWAEANGHEMILSPSGGASPEVAATMRESGANGIILWPADPSKLLLADHGARGLSVLDRDTFERDVIVSSYDDQSLNSPNDMVARSDGAIFFTDPPYGLRGLNDAPEKELQHNGVYLYSSDALLKLIIDDLTFPNGIALSPDERTLYVAVSDPDNAKIMAYTVADDGSVNEGRVFFDASGELKEGGGLPDGMVVARNGTVFATGPEGVYVLAPETGEVLGVISTGMPTSNCTLNDDETYLYMTSSSVLARVPISF